jgi:hypothetical protein
VKRKIEFWGVRRR